MINLLEVRGEKNIREEIRIENTYVIKDNKGGYADKDSLYINKKKELSYVSSPTILNGCHYFNDVEKANSHLKQLNKLSNLFNVDFGFYIDNINYDELIEKELLANV